jgi:hypothetical protein
MAARERPTELDPRRWARRRAGLVGSAFGVGAVAGLVGRLALALTAVDPVVATTKAFAVGALCLGFGTLGWSGSVLAGPGIENAQRHLDVRTDWSERDSRRAMARLAGFGAGVMGGVVVGARLLSAQRFWGAFLAL